MTEVRFYHLQYQPEARVLPVILQRAVERGNRVLVKVRDKAALVQMDEHLWTFVPDSFLPHGVAGEKHAALQPVLLTTEDENLNGADTLVLCQGASSEMQGDFTLCCEMLDGQDPQAVADARTRWKAYKEKEFDVTYWQQDERGKWEKKA